MKTISVTVNGKVHAAEVEPRTSVADFLREELLRLGLRGVKGSRGGAFCQCPLEEEIGRASWRERV